MEYSIFNRKNENKEIQTNNKQRIWNFFILVLIVGILMSVLLSLKSIDRGKDWVTYLQLLGTCLLMGGASFGIGALSGFLFGIPKILNPETNHSDPEKKRKMISQNDNLVQISDWLTKIIVGIGLTQLYHIPKALRILGEYFSSIFHDTESGNIALSIIFYFFVFGFLFAYLWVRLYFTEMIQQVENSLGEKIEAELKEQGLKVKAMAEVINDAQQKMADIGGGKTTSENLDDVKADIKNKTIGEPGSPEDPQKGKWGGKTENNDRKITAKIELSDVPGYYKVTLEVSSTNPSNPLTGVVKFHLHPTFNNSEPIIAVTEGTATLVLNTVYGAFTAGAETDDGKTQLEIDLAELSNAPKDFKEK